MASLDRTRTLRSHTAWPKAARARSNGARHPSDWVATSATARVARVTVRTRARGGRMNDRVITDPIAVPAAWERPLGEVTDG